MSVDRQPYCVFKRFVDYPSDEEQNIEMFYDRCAIEGRAYLQKKYGKVSRQLLTENEFLEFLKYLQNQ
jgi:hypothetical protein